MNAAVHLSPMTTQIPPIPQATPEPGQEPEAGLSSRVSDGQANSIYAVAYGLSQQGKHEQAATLFTMLTIYRPREPKYTRAVAICLRKMGQYQEAIRQFARTMELKPDSYEPAFQLIECMLLLGRREAAVELLETMAAMAGDTGQLRVLEQSRTMLELLYAAPSGTDAVAEEATVAGAEA